MSRVTKFQRLLLVCVPVLCCGGFNGFSAEVTEPELRGTINAVKESPVALAFSPDGKTLAGAMREGRIVVWDVAAGKELTSFKGHESHVTAVAFSPDGKSLASASADKTVKMWDPNRGNELAVMKGHSQIVKCVAFSPDGKSLASGSWDNTVKLWSPATGEEQATLKANVGEIDHLAYSPDGKLLAVGGRASRIQLWDLETSKELAMLKALRSGATSALVFSPDSTTLAAGTEDNQIRLWDIATRTERLSLKGHKAEPDFLAFVEATTLISANWKAIKIWDIAAQKELAKIEDDTERALAYCAKLKMFAVRGPGEKIQLWSLTHGGSGSASGSSSSSGSGSGTGSAGASGSGERGKPLPEPVSLPLNADPKDRYLLTALSISADGKTLAVGVTRASPARGCIRLYELPTGKLVHTLEGQVGSVTTVAFAPDGKTLAAAGTTGTLQRWELPSGKELPGIKSSRAAGHSRLQFTADGKKLVAVNGGQHLQVWKLADGEELCCHEVKFDKFGIGFVHLDSDGNTATIAPLSGGLARRIDLATGKETAQLKSYAKLVCRAFSTDGKQLFGYDWGPDAQQVIVAWDLGKDQVMEVASCALAPVSLAATSDGKLAAAFDDGTVRIWDRDSRQELAQFRAYAGQINRLLFSPDGRMLVTGAGMDDVKLWTLADLPASEPPPIKKEPRPKESKPPDKEQIALAARAQKILKSCCHRCHGQDGAAEGGFNYILDRSRLLESKKIVPGKPAQSLLYKRIAGEEMPPEDEKTRPSDDDIAALRKWIVAGAPDWAEAVEARAVITLEKIARAVEDDRTRFDPKDREHLRYLMISHLYNLGQAEDELQTLRLAVAKLINSVSMGERVVPPVPIDAEKTILRIDLRDYKISPKLWKDTVERGDPYGLAFSLDPKKEPVQLPIRGDWFVFSASRPPLYHELARVPWTLSGLEKELKIDFDDNISSARAVRAGFNNSGISRNNRLIERHQSIHGYCWRSYDFAGSAGRQNLFAHPQGPGLEAKTFQHDGGEIIYQLPNGLQAYMLVDRPGNRINKAPNNIVSDPKHPDRVVQNGISCMSCHLRGLIEKADQIRPHVEKNPDSFSTEEQKAILSLYPTSEKFLAILQKDADAYQKALAGISAPAGTTEPIHVTSLRFEAEMDLREAAAELWLTPDELLKRLDDFPSLARPLGALRNEGGTIQRQVFIRYFASAIRLFRIAELVAGNWNDSMRDGNRVPPLRTVIAEKGDDFLLHIFHEAAYKGVPNPIIPPPAVDPGFQWTAAIADRKLVQIYDAANDKLIATIKDTSAGPEGRVSAFAFSPCGKLLAIACSDGRLRIWSWEKAELLCEIPRSKDQPYASWSAGFAPDGRRLAAVALAENSGIQILGLPGGKKLLSLRGGLDPHRLAFSPDGNTLLAVDGDYSLFHLTLWDVPILDQDTIAATATRPRAVLIGEEGALASLTFSPDGTCIATASGGGTIALWHLGTGQRIGADRLAHHRDRKKPNVVHCVAYSHDGSLLATAHDDGCITLWATKTMHDIFTFRAHDESVLRTVAFSADGDRLMSSACDGSVRFWDTRKLLAAAAVRE